MYNLGIVVGKFAPLTFGHINLINEAAAACEKVIVVLSHDQRWVDRQSPRDQHLLSEKNKYRWLTQTFADMPHIETAVIDESQIPEFPNGWPEYCKLLEGAVAHHVSRWVHDEMNRRYANAPAGSLIRMETPVPTIAIFSSEDAYTENYAKYLPEYSHVVVDNDRTEVPISATKIRENLYQYWQYLPSVVRRDYCRRVMVMGLESTGKSTLVKNLAKLYGTSWVEEYGRTYCQSVLAGSEYTLRSDDYPIIAYQHKALETAAQATANRVCFIDTAAFSTEFFHRRYEGVPNPVVSAIAANEHYDLVLVLSAEVPWVDDGLRSSPDRVSTGQLWDTMVAEFPNQFPEGRTVYITGSSYLERWHQAKAAVNDYMSAVVRGEL